MDDLHCDESSLHEDAIERARPHIFQERIALRLADLFKGLGDSTRLRIMSALAQTELCVDDLAALIGMTPSAVSHQLRLLRTLGLVRPRKEGRHVFYSLDDDHVESLLHCGLAHIQHQHDFLKE